MKKSNTSVDIRKLTYMAMLSAIVAVLGYFGQFIKLGMFSITLVLVPVVVGAAICGVSAGAWLGFVFGLFVLFSGDAAAFWAIDVGGTVITVILKGILAGLAGGIVYKLTAKKNQYAAVFAAAVITPIVNTGVFLLGCAVFFMDDISKWAQVDGYASPWPYILLVLVGGNFLFELLFNIILSPGILTLIKISPRLRKKRK